MKRYDFDELTKHECDDGEWVKADEAEAEIAALLKQIEVASLRLGILQTENERLRKALEFIASSIPTGTGYSHAHLAKKTLEDGR